MESLVLNDVLVDRSRLILRIELEQRKEPKGKVNSISNFIKLKGGFFLDICSNTPLVNFGFLENSGLLSSWLLSYHTRYSCCMHPLETFFLVSTWAQDIIYNLSDCSY